MQKTPSIEPCTVLYKRGQARCVDILCEECSAKVTTACEESDSMAYIEYLHVYPEYRKAGFGTAILRLAEATAKWLGCKRARLKPSIDSIPPWVIVWLGKEGYEYESSFKAYAKSLGTDN